MPIYGNNWPSRQRGASSASQESGQLGLVTSLVAVPRHETSYMYRNWGEPERSPTLLSSMHSAVYYICIYISIRTTSRLLRMRQMFHVKHGVDAPPTTCMRSPKRKSSEIDASPQLPISTGVQCLDRGYHGRYARSIEITKVSYHGGSSPEY